MRLHPYFRQESSLSKKCLYVPVRLNFLSAKTKKFSHTTGQIGYRFDSSNRRQSLSTETVMKTESHTSIWVDF